MFFLCYFCVMSDRPWLSTRGRNYLGDGGGSSGCVFVCVCDHRVGSERKFPGCNIDSRLREVRKFVFKIFIYLSEKWSY